MQCPLCSHPKAHKHGLIQERSSTLSAQLAIKRSQRALTACTIAVISAQSKFAPVLQAHGEGSSLRGISRTTGLA